jgi:glycosyltransferase involved in cell wall biosynthesis
MSSRRALWVSTSTETRGGVATYVRAMRRTPLWDLWDIRHVATHRNGSVASRVIAFITGTGSFIRELVLRRPALVHLHTSFNGSFARKSILAWISRSAGVPVVMHVHSGGFREFYSRSPRLLQHYIRVTLEGADAVIALGEKWAGALRQIAPGARIAVVSNAVELRTPVDQPGPGEPVHVLFLGDIEDHKGAFLLLEAWSQLADRSFPGGADLVMAGGGAVARARNRAEELGITDQVQVMGWVAPAQVEALLSGSHVLVLPSTFEGQPMAVLEAMAHGLCVVATDVGGVPDLVADCGVLLPVGDLASLIDTLRQVISDAEQRAKLGSRGFRRVQERFDVNFTWRALDTLYEELAR